MDKDTNFHQGHRQRITKRFMENPSATADHEILEMLLFPLLPRKDTNALAHRLIRTFGGLSQVFKASIKDLMTVDGVGEKIATQIKLIGLIVNRVGEEKPSKKKLMASFHLIRGLIIEDFSELSDEKFLIYLLDDKYRKIVSIAYEDKNISSVTAEVPELSTAISIHKPRYAIIAHNHPSGEVEPSTVDDLATKKLCLLCSLYGVTLIDHVIVHDHRTYSYHQEGRMEEMRSKANLDRLLQD